MATSLPWAATCTPSRSCDERGVELVCSSVWPTVPKLHVDEGDKVKRGQRLAEWDPHTRPMMTEVAGTVQFEDLVDGLSVLEATDELTGITKRQVIDWRSTPRGSDLKPAIVIKDASAAISRSCLVVVTPASSSRSMRSCRSSPGTKAPQGDVVARFAARKRQDQVTSPWSAACCRVVRSPPPEGPRHHRRDRWYDPPSAATTRTSVASSSSRRKTVSSLSNT